MNLLPALSELSGFILNSLLSSCIGLQCLSQPMGNPGLKDVAINPWPYQSFIQSTAIHPSQSHINIMMGGIRAN